MRVPLAAPLALAAAGLAGCFASASRFPPPAEVAPDAEAVEALADSLAGAPSPAARRAVAARRLAAAGVTPLAGGVPGAGPGGGTFQAGLAVPLVGGFVPGGRPVARDALVVVGASLEGPAAPAVLEAARVLVARSLWETTPERTVEVVFWSGDARDGAAGALRLPLWPRDAVRAVLVVGDDVGAEVEGVPAFSLAAPGPADAALAARVVRRVLELAEHADP
jgi:hypothetical protein